MEIWAAAIDCFDHVEVSNLGRVRIRARDAVCIRLGKPAKQTRPARVMRAYIAQNGYPTVSIAANGKRKKFLVHRLVARAFVDGYQDGLSVNHKNCIKTDNRPENLEWVSLAENTRLQWKDGLVDLRGDNHPSAILKTEQVATAKRLMDSGARVPDIAAILGISVSMAYKIKQGRRWAHI